MRRIFIALGVLAVAAVAAAGYWHYAAGLVRDGITAWVEELRAQGYMVTYRELTVSGFPLWLRAKVRDPVIRQPDAEMSWQWRGPELEASARPWNYREIDLRLPTASQLGVDIAGATHTMTTAADSATGHLTIDWAGRPQRAEVDFSRLEVGLLGEWGKARADRLRIEAVPQGSALASRQDATLDIALTVEGLTLPDSVPAILGNRIGLLIAQGSLVGRVDPGPVRDTLSRWRDDGGAVEVERFVLHWGPLDLNASGTLAVDEGMRPLGALHAEIRGFQETLDALVAGKIVPDGHLNTARTVLNLLARQPSAGDRPVLSVPVSAQNGRLFVGPLPLATLPPVVP